MARASAPRLNAHIPRRNCGQPSDARSSAATALPSSRFPSDRCRRPGSSSTCPACAGARETSMEARNDVQGAIGEREPLIIRRVDAIPLGLPLAKPVAMAGGKVRQAPNILVRIESADGTVGWGEAASAPTMTGDTLGSLLTAVRDQLAPMLIGEDAWMRPALRHKLGRALFGNTGAHSAIEVALLDLAGRASGRPRVDLI